MPWNMIIMTENSKVIRHILKAELKRPCREPAWGTLPMAKVMRKEARHTQRRDWASGVPLEILEHLPPKPELAYFTTLCSHLHLWLYGGLSPTTSFGEGVNLQLQLIIIPGHDRSVSTYKLLWRFSSLPDRFVRPHVIVHSLPTVEAWDVLKCLNTDSFEQLKDWLEIVLVKGFSLVETMFADKFPYPLPTVSLAVYWLI